MNFLTFFYKKGRFGGVFDRLSEGRMGEKNLQKMKLLVHTLLTSHKSSPLEKNCPCYDLKKNEKKRDFGGVFDPLREGEGGNKNLKLLVHTLLMSHKSSPLDHFWPRYELFDIFYGPTD